MHYEGDFEVLRRLFYKKKWLEGGYEQHKSIRPTLLILSGTMRGVYGGGQVIALKRFGLSHVFDCVVAVSTGAPTAAYFLAGQPEIGTTIYFNECTTNEFISFGRALRGEYIANVDYLADVFRGKRSYKGLDQGAVLRCRSRFLVAATCTSTGEGVLLEAKCVRPDLVEALRAAIALPGFSHGHVRIDEVNYCDGVGALPLPTTRIIREVCPTDLLVLANRPKGHRGSSLESSIQNFLLARYPREVREVFRERRTLFESELSVLRSQTACRVGIIWSDDEVSSFCRSPSRLEAAAKRAQSHLEIQLSEARLQSSVL